jgi:hypothetical protein
MSPSRPTIRIRPRSAIADAALARAALTDLPGAPRTSSRAIRGPHGLLQIVRTLGRPMEPERVIVMPLATAPAPTRRR